MQYILLMLRHILLPCLILLLPSDKWLRRHHASIETNQLSVTSQTVHESRTESNHRGYCIPKPLSIFLDNLKETWQAGIIINDIVRRVEEMLGNIAEEEKTSEINKAERYFNELDNARKLADSVILSPGWVEAGSREGVKVWKKCLPKHFYGSSYSCVKAVAEIDMNANDFVDYLMDSSKVTEYNKYSIGRVDIASLDPFTKIVWNKTSPPLTRKNFDFCTLMNVDCRENGSFVITTHATEHANAPILDNYIRSEIILGVTIVEPCSEDPENRATITTVNHIVSPGIPAIVANKVSLKNAIDFLVDVQKAATRRKKLT